MNGQASDCREERRIISALWLITQRARAHRQQLFLSFVDCQKAFYRVKSGTKTVDMAPPIPRKNATDVKARLIQALVVGYTFDGNIWRRILSLGR